jgi:CRP/FNR family transcriptional regulator
MPRVTTPPLPAELEAIVPQTFLGRLPVDLAGEVLSTGRRVEIPRGGLLAQSQGRPRVAVVVEGLVRSFMKSPQGREVTVRYSRPGETLGLVQTLGARIEIEAQAVTTAVLWTLPSRRLRELAMASAPLAMAIAEDCAQRVVDATEELSYVTFGSVRQRVARHLLDLAAAESHESELVAPVTPQALADATGSVREVVARVLKELDATGVTGRSPRGSRSVTPPGSTKRPAATGPRPRDPSGPEPAAAPVERT